MKTNKNIRTLEELHNEIHRLKIDYTDRGVLLKNDTKTYINQFSLGNLIKRCCIPFNKIA